MKDNNYFRQIQLDKIPQKTANLKFFKTSATLMVGFHCPRHSASMNNSVWIYERVMQPTLKKLHLHFFGEPTGCRNDPRKPKRDPGTWPVVTEK